MAAIVGLVVDVTGVFHWRVDATSVGLIGVLLLIPVAEHLRKLKFGSLEAEFTEKVNYLDRRVSEISELATEPSEDASVSVEVLAVSPVDLPSRAIYRIVWVDDRPAGNRLEIAEMQRRFDVITATSTAEGLSQVSKGADKTAVITDAVRVESGEENVNAGLDLLEQLQKQYPAIPVYVYCGPDTVENFAGPLEHAGARIVTASFTDLAAMIRADARISFEAEIASILKEFGEVEAQSDGVDFVVEIGGHRVGIEAKDYRRTPKASAVDKALGLLGEAIARGQIRDGLVVAPRDVFIDSQRARAPSGVGLVSVDELRQAMTGLSSKDSEG